MIEEMLTHEVCAKKFEAHVREGLRKQPKQLSSQYLYDALGSALFEQITRQPEYYVPSAEMEILTAHARDIRSLVGDGKLEIIEFGCGCHEKTFILLEAFNDVPEVTYFPIDISNSSLLNMRVEFMRRLPRMRIHPMVAEYRHALDWLKKHKSDKKRLFLFLGLSLGNMMESEASQFLIEVGDTMNTDDRFVVGFDLQKDLRTLSAAYNDAAKMTAAFNLNLLERINRELGGTFDVAHFEHHSYYDPVQHAMVSWLVANRDHRVTIGHDYETQFRQGEGIFIERSRKWTLSEIVVLSEKARLQIKGEFLDSRMYFLDAVFASM